MIQNTAPPAGREGSCMKPSNEQLIKGLPRRILLMLLDCALIVLCFYLSIVLRYDDAATLAAQNIIDTPSREAVITAMTPMLIYILPIYMGCVLVRRAV